MLQLLALHLVAALAAPTLMRVFGRRGFFVLALVPLSVAVWALAHTRQILDGNPVHVRVEWIPSLGASLDFRVDGLTWLMLLLVGGIGAMVLFYCAWYFASGAKYLNRFAATFVAFAGSMLGLVASDNTLVLFVFWELTTITSYLLIGHYFERKGSRRSAMEALVVTVTGGLAMLAGFLILGEMPGGSYRFSELVADPPAGSAMLGAALVLVLLGALSKSALVPFHFWLPGAMAAPTPVSAYLHAAAMVKAGVYLVARLAPGFAENPIWYWIVLVSGSVTMLLGGYRAMRQHDLKLLLAFGTVSQLGFLILLVGQPDRGIALAGLALIGAHAMFKAALFLTVGVIDAAAGTRDLRELSGLARNLRGAFVPGLLGVVSMVGLPPAAGYVGKEAVLEAVTDGGEPRHWVLMAVVVIGSILTFAYGMRFLWGAYARKPGVADTELEPEHIGLFIAPNLLAAAGIVAGLVPALGEHLLAPYALTYPVGQPGHLTLWAGFGIPLALTVLIVVLGSLLALGRSGVERVQERISPPVDADRTYRDSMRQLDRFSAALTRYTQSGALPVYLGVILVTTLVLVTVALFDGDVRIGEYRLWDSPVSGGAAIVIVISSLLVARARRRIKAVVLMGVAGYGVVLLFALHGSPDLALTQALVETVTIVVFLLVLRRLPAYYSNRPLAASRWWRVAVAVLAGALMSFLALAIPGTRVHEEVSQHFFAEGYQFGWGNNIVNVTLVDIRAWDTMGEIAVLLVAATGVASLVFLRIRDRGVERIRDRDPDGAPGWSVGPRPDPALRRLGDPGIPATGRRDQQWLPGGSALAPYRRSVIFEVITRMLFHTMLVLAVWLLFAGHNAPGGGFIAGMVAGVALIVRYLAGGRYELGEALPVLPGTLLGLGLLLATGTGIAPIFFGGEVLQSLRLDLNLGILGEVHLMTTLSFDIGVFLIVVGLVLDILRSLGAEVDRHGEAEGRAAPDVAHDSPRSTVEDTDMRAGATLSGSAPESRAGEDS
ncbi:Na+/H+ antiporter subunit A [Pseudactinotalea sp. Z1748]|uniref:Na+/H+ antiporter subunit A n=1 Tax=Pseudactinotalea sp. Z1748 TaxID=3413027 RepID=UPI003C7DD586